MIKKFLSLTLLISMLFTTVVYAATTEYKLRDIDLIANLPEDLIVFTRETSTADPNYDYIELEPLAFTADMEQRSIYLYAFDKENTYDITITSSVSADDENYNELSVNALNEIIKSKRSELIDSDTVTINDITLFNHSTVPMIVYDTINSADDTNINKVYMLEYTTIYDGTYYNIKLQTFGTEITPQQREMFKEIVGDMEFADLNGSSVQNRIFNEVVGLLIGAAITIAILGFIIFILNISKKNKKKHIL